MATILVVDDNPEEVTLIREAIREIGSDAFVFHVDGVDKAIGFVSRQRDLATMATPDLVVVDIDMPGGDGFELLRRIRLIRVDIPVFMWSSSELAADRQRAKQLGAEQYLAKACTWGDQLALARRILDRIAPRESSPAL
jgi:CheY-like chemotaxis protein